MKQMMDADVLPRGLDLLQQERPNFHHLTKKVDANIISHLEGTLLRSRSFFPYYMLMALEAGNPLRFLLMLLLYPATSLISCFSESLAMAVQIFVAVAGVKQEDVLAVSRGVLPKFFLEDLDVSVATALLRHGNVGRYVITSHPRIFVDHFLSHHLGVDGVLGTELLVSEAGICTGFVAPSGDMADESRKLEALKRCFHWRDNSPALVGLTCKSSSGSNTRSSYLAHTFLSLCQNIITIMRSNGDETLAKDKYRNPIIFHDGRLVMRPTPIVSLVIILWLPFGLLLAMGRILVGMCLPNFLAFPLASLLGLKVRVKGAPPIFEGNEGTIFVCTHRTLADPIFLSMALRRRVKALTYKISKVSELISPIPIASLTRNREKDARIINELLKKQDICICPEGTTCREAFLLRFSPLFASLTNRVVPVAINVKLSMFHGTSARGYKAFDGIFYCLNPRPLYEIMFLDPLPMDTFRAEGKTTIEIANVTQKLLADKLGFQCTNYNRKDKYNMLAGHNGNF